MTDPYRRGASTPALFDGIEPQLAGSPRVRVPLQRLIASSALQSGLTGPNGRLRPLPVPRRRGPDKPSTPISRRSSSRKIVVEPPRDPAHGDLSTNAAMVVAKPLGKNPREIATAARRRLQGRPRGHLGRGRRPRLPQLPPRRRRLASPCSRAALEQRRRFRPRRHRQGREGQRRVRLGQPDRSDACRPYPRRRVRRRAGLADGLLRLRRDPRVLHQRRRRPDRDARPVGVPALSRGARRGHRDPARPLSRRLPDPGRAGARRRVRRHAPLQARGRVAAHRQGARPRGDDGADPGRPRKLDIHHDVFFSERTLHGQGEDIDLTLDWLREQGLVYQGRLEPPKGKTPTRTGRTASRPCSAPTTLATTPIGALVKSDGSYTYFAADIAYHRNKCPARLQAHDQRLGADHSGYVKRLEAAVKAVSGGKADSRRQDHASSSGSSRTASRSR